jgi:hypothetical protein
MSTEPKAGDVDRLGASGAEELERRRQSARRAKAKEASMTKPSPEVRKARAIENPKPAATSHAEERLTVCPECGGFGGVHKADGWKVCPKCKGGGRV